jgi:hypothetical protein
MNIGLKFGVIPAVAQEAFHDAMSRGGLDSKGRPVQAFGPFACEYQRYLRKIGAPRASPPD